jgi:hypothetical protein
LPTGTSSTDSASIGRNGGFNAAMVDHGNALHRNAGRRSAFPADGFLDGNIRPLRFTLR